MKKINQTANETGEYGAEMARRFLEALVDGTAADGPTLETNIFEGLTVVEVAEGRIVCELPVTERVRNRYNTLHGGATATLVDSVSTAALLTACSSTGVSVHLACTYLAPMPVGHTVSVDARVTRVGRQLASLAVELRRRDTGQLVASGTHTKYLQVDDSATQRLRERVQAEAGARGRARELPAAGAAAAGAAIAAEPRSRL